MATKKLKGRDLRKIGFPEGKVIKVALKILATHYKNKSRSYKLELMKKVFGEINELEQDKIWKPLAQEYKAKIRPVIKKATPKTGAVNYFGRSYISENAFHQMEMAMKLPIAEKGALMPDAHYGYGLPIGGVLATKNAVIPYAVGLDIGCRMSLSILDMAPTFFERKIKKFRIGLIDHTCFGNETFVRPGKSAVLEDKRFDEIEGLRKLKKIAHRQLGTSGSGNHFVEYGITTLSENAQLGIPAGDYVSILTHSGSRGFGATIAQHYSQLAKLKSNLPKNLRHLSYLDLNSEAGQSYWHAMQLAGDYAKACHDDIHNRLITALGGQQLFNIENHHNFAWMEEVDGVQMVVHRKGATPAGKDVLGIIPGSMCTRGFIVKGKGNPDSLNSASHGAGRKFSRAQARASLHIDDLKSQLNKARVDLVGGEVDESPHAYKDIEKVMSAQTDLVEVIGHFQPRVVRMSGRKWR